MFDASYVKLTPLIVQVSPEFFSYSHPQKSQDSVFKSSLIFGVPKNQFSTCNADF